MEDLKDLKVYLKESKQRIAQMVAVRNRIEVEPHKDTKRLLSISITQMETSMLYLKEAIEEQERLPVQRFG